MLKRVNKNFCYKQWSVFFLIFFQFFGACSILPEDNAKINWEKDIDYFIEQLKKHHAAYDNFISEEQLKVYVNQLKARIPELTEVEVHLELEKLGALIGDGHTWLSNRFNQDLSTYQLCPVYFSWFEEDGYRVVGVQKQYSELLGARLKAINGKPLETLEQQLDSYVPQNENRYYRHYWLSYWLRNADALCYENTCAFINKIDYEFILDDGMKLSYLLPVLQGTLADEDFVYAYQPIPFFMQNQDAKIWHRSLDNNTYFIKVNSYPESKETQEILIQILENLSLGSYRKIVFDFRKNGGGNKDQVEKIIDQVYANNKTALFYAVTGDHTFSAGLSNAVYLREKCMAKIIGEPPTNRPNFYAENYFGKLQNSKVEFSIATQYLTHQLHNRALLEMDKTILRSFYEYKKGKDPVLRWVLEQ